MTQLDKLIKEFITNICDVLQITYPTIISSDLGSDMFAAYEPNENAIYINTKRCRNNLGKVNVELFIAIAHELRHAYQFKHNLSCIQKYKERKYFNDTESYNLQPAEIDANAFADIIIVDSFGLQVQWQNYSVAVRNKITERIPQIAAELQ